MTDQDQPTTVAHQVRPMSISNVFRSTWEYCAENRAQLMTPGMIILLIYTVEVLLNLIITSLSGSDISRMTGLASSVLVLYPQALIIYHLVQRMGGNTSVTMFDARIAIRSRWAVMIAVYFVYGLVSGFGLLLFVIPGLIWMVVYVVATHATIAEGTSFTASFRRSADLTRGNRWRVLLFVLVFVALLAVFVGLVMLMFGGNLSVLDTLSETHFWVINFGVAVVNAPLMVLLTAVFASLYVELVRCRGGGVSPNMANVFD